MAKKEKYKEFCEENPNIPIFSQPWWLDAVSEGGIWDVASRERRLDEATMPYYIRRDMDFFFFTMPN